MSSRVFEGHQCGAGSSFSLRFLQLKFLLANQRSKTENENDEEEKKEKENERREQPLTCPLLFP